METSYVVLRDGTKPVTPNSISGSAPGYTRVGTFTSSSAEAAVRVAAAKAGEGTYIAIPERSFKPVTVKIETKQVVSLG